MNPLRIDWRTFFSLSEVVCFVAAWGISVWALMTFTPQAGPAIASNRLAATADVATAHSTLPTTLR